MFDLRSDTVASAARSPTARAAWRRGRAAVLALVGVLGPSLGVALPSAVAAVGSGGATAASLSVGVAAVLAAIALPGCGAPPASEAFLLSMAEADRAYSAGRYAEAAAAFHRAAEQGTRVKDRDEGRFMEARMFEKLSQPARAQAIYRQLIGESPTGPRTVRAIFEVANIEIARGDAARGWAALQAAVLRYPNHGSARKALTQVVEHLASTQGEPAARTFLEKAQPGFVGTEAEQQGKFELGRSYERSGELERARDALVAVAREYPYPAGNLTDDAYWYASLLEEKLGRYAEAVALLREMLSPREEGITGASYERPRFPGAQLRIAKLYRDRLHDPATARREFHRMVEVHPDALSTPSALWQEAVLAYQAGDRDEACKVLELIASKYSTSRYLRCADRLCASAKPTDTARGCPPYILRTITGEPDPSEDEDYSPHEAAEPSGEQDSTPADAGRSP